MLCTVVGITVVFVPLTRSSVLVTVVRCVVVFSIETVATNVVEILLNTAPAAEPTVPLVRRVDVVKAPPPALEVFDPKSKLELVQIRVVLARDPVC